ncbi:AI-2E family transporter [Tichowtungia aerotolerans]|uniref:AI-2E family transporter n=1 Tax=Tichowtungia aerotolerans TaxID=2697043 RepID=A0A6P1MGU7_9BACT|nr:AI-2E family transporter [Tichowtungia aerotolerans]QHI70806.1 AI-2E family transporter [Tichowtungia aerotolerans]
MQDNRYLIPFLGVITLVMVGVVLKAAQVVILPLIIAWLLSYLFAPVVNFLAKHKVPTGVSVLAVLLIVVGFFYLIAIFVQTRVMGFIAQYDEYAVQLNQIASDAMSRFHIPENYFDDFDWTGQVGKRLVVLSGSFVSIVSNMGMILIFLVFMLLGKPYSQRKIEYAFAPERADKITSVTNSITGQISRYLSIKLMISAITAVLVWVVLVIMKVDFPMTWAVFTFLLNFIPTVGSVIATVPPVLVALVQFYPSFWPAVVVLILLLAIQQMMGSFIEPKLMGNSLNLSPVVILLSLVFWGWLWGIVGALLSVPITAAIKIVCENIEALKPISVLMGAGRTLHN